MDKVPNITKKQLLPYIKKAWRGLQAYLNAQKEKLGPLYKRNNIYEQFSNKFCDPAKETEKFFDEYMLCLNKASKQPASTRQVVLYVGRQAIELIWQRGKSDWRKGDCRGKRRKRLKRSSMETMLKIRDGP